MKNPSGKHYEILHLHMQGMSQTDIAAAVGYSIAAVGNIVNSQWAQDEIRKLHKNVIDDIAENRTPHLRAKAFADEAVSNLINLARGARNESVKMKANELFLAMNGMTQKTSETFDEDEILDRMTHEEQEAFAATGKLPARFRECAVSKSGAAGEVEPADSETNVIDLDSKRTLQ